MIDPPLRYSVTIDKYGDFIRVELPHRPSMTIRATHTIRQMEDIVFEFYRQVLDIEPTRDDIGQMVCDIASQLILMRKTCQIRKRPLIPSRMDKISHPHF